MLVTLCMLYHALAYSLGHLWILISPLRSILTCAIDATTYHPTMGRNIIIDIIMTICTLLVWSTLVGCMLLRKEDPAKRAPSCAPPPASFLISVFQHVSLNQANESMVNALKAVQKARDDFKEMEDASAPTMEALWRLRQAGKDIREIHQTIVEMSDMLNKQTEQLSRTFPINSGGAG
ncbi:uncharacterized protein BJ212DRAFT_1586790 [Suillus subaureus]|uniref:Uncharacterized protein n=1 Tax=Suillus subaureus TaxID=48587 RepID=A0A9P7EF15_9AGAM|nr:uncharacterized protein BJ212DRAFT_1586790 [Suillus subaureus]KAG1819210.1 hypothetical protein BJ212DRAFT_1586790 [Suillus subaureus]